MGRPVLGLLLVAALAGGAYLATNFHADVRRGHDGRVQQITIVPRADKPGAVLPGWADSTTNWPPIHIATFHFGRIDDKTLANRQVGNVLARLFPGFDLVALQDVRATDRRRMVRLIDLINSGGHAYDFAVAPAVGDSAGLSYNAFVFNTATIEIDRAMVQHVEDPANRFRHKPLVGLFRANGPDPSEAFTFKLINVHIDPTRATVELDLIDDVYRAVRDGRPEEDDVILLGNFATDHHPMGTAAATTDLIAAITGTPTSLSGTRTVDNIFFPRRATVEFSGRSGVVDLMRQFGLERQQAAEVTDHSPVWVQCSSYEGGSLGHVAGNTGRKAR